MSLGRWYFHEKKIIIEWERNYSIKNRVIKSLCKYQAQRAYWGWSGRVLKEENLGKRTCLEQ